MDKIEELKAAYLLAESQMDLAGMAACGVAVMQMLANATREEGKCLADFFARRYFAVLLAAMEAVEQGKGKLAEYYFRHFRRMLY